MVLLLFRQTLCPSVPPCVQMLCSHIKTKIRIYLIKTHTVPPQKKNVPANIFLHTGGAVPRLPTAEGRDFHCLEEKTNGSCGDPACCYLEEGCFLYEWSCFSGGSELFKGRVYLEKRNTGILNGQVGGKSPRVTHKPRQV